MMSGAQPINAHIIDQSLNEYIVMSYYLKPPVNHHQLTCFPFTITMTDCGLANRKPNTNYITSPQNVWNVEIANLPAKYHTLLNVNISASTQFIDLKHWELGNLKYGQNLVRRPLNHTLCYILRMFGKNSPAFTKKYHKITRITYQRSGWQPKHSRHCSQANMTLFVTTAWSVRNGLDFSQAINFFHSSTYKIK